MSILCASDHSEWPDNIGIPIIPSTVGHHIPMASIGAEFGSTSSSSSGVDSIHPGRRTERTINDTRKTDFMCLLEVLSMKEYPKIQFKIMFIQRIISIILLQRIL